MDGKIVLMEQISTAYRIAVMDLKISKFLDQLSDY
jgi:hypothetical protein